MQSENKYTLLAYDEKGYADEGVEFTETELVHMYKFLSMQADDLDANEADRLAAKLKMYFDGLLIKVD